MMSAQRQKRLVREKRASRKDIAEFVYRTDAMKHVEWGVFDKQFRTLTPEQRERSVSASVGLKVEFLRSFVQQKGVYSLPTVSAEVLGGLANAESEGDAVGLLEGCAAVSDEFTFFEVLDARPERRKLLRTQSICIRQ